MESMEGTTAPDAPKPYPKSVPVPSTPPRREQPAGLFRKIHSTPYKQHSSAVVMNDNMKWMDEDVLSFVKVEFRDKIHREYPVRDFVKHVWNFNEDDDPNLSLKIRSFAPQAATIASYNEAANEVSYYPHLETVANDLLTHLFPDPTARAVESNIVIIGNHKVAGDYASFKPDLVWSTTPGPTNQRWDWLALCAEVKRGKIEKALDPETVLEGDVPLPEPTDERRKTGKRPAAKHGLEPSRKRLKQDKVTPHEAQTAKYLNEMLSHGIRSFASGFFIKDRVMHLWYGDRMGLVKSSVFDWQANPDLMALVFAAVGTANLAKLGISPLLKFSPTSSKFNGYEGGRIVLPANEVVFEDSQERPSEDLVLKIDTTRKVWTDWGAVGRGTTIVPLEASERLGTEALVVKMAWPHANRTSEDKFIRIVRRKLQQKAPGYLRHIVVVKCFMTRTMMEMRLPRAFMDIRLDSEDKRDFRLIVMKTYEHLESVKSVDEFKTVFEHVVRAHHWVWTTSGVLHHDLSTSNIMFYRNTDGQAVGVLCDWDMAEEKLSDAEYQADDARLFSVHTVPKEDSPPTTAAQGKALSTIEEQDGTPQTTGEADEAILEERPPRPRYRTGTGLFIALELLLQKEPPLHRYRHDLESLFYVLAYFCAVFNPEKHQFGRLNEWERNNFGDIAQSKTLFLMSQVEYCISIFNDCHEDYKPLVEEWVMPLWELFADAASEKNRIFRLLRERNSADRLGREDIVAKRNKEIVRSIAAWQKAITYETFMECLGLPPHLSTDPQY
ncbi:hypothetical protein B0H21DRAFT_881436 [Amylocystis lapponica]|nr:hypothetical protein B0H21DRAFT_881436 [Amylocystis lapponica]